MIILVCGSRSIRDRKDRSIIVDSAFKILQKEAQKYGLDGIITLVKHGNAPGADILCSQWARDMGIKELPFPAKWDDWQSLPKNKILLRSRNGRRYNSLAGFNRNAEMVESGFDVGLAIRMGGQSSGTDDTIKLIIKAGKPLLIYHVDGVHEWL